MKNNYWHMKKTAIIISFIITLFHFQILAQNKEAVSKLKNEYTITNLIIDENGVPSYIEGNLTPKGVLGEEKEKALKFFNENKDLFGMSIPENELKVKTIEKDELQMIHIRFNQYYKDIPVYGHELIAHYASNGELKTVNGSFLSGINIPNNPTINVAFAKQKVISDISSNFRGSSYNVTEAKLYIYKFQNNIYLSWLVRISLENPSGRWEYFVNAVNGDLIYKANRLMKMSTRCIRNKKKL